MAERAEQLRQLRADLGLTQQEMANKYGVFLRTYQRWESGESGVREFHLDLARHWLSEKTEKTDKAPQKPRPAGKRHK